jgi:hypothetical protein
MARFLMRKALGCLRPEDAAGEEAMRAYAIDDVMMVEIRKPRNIRHHQLYWVLLGKVFENQERYPSIEQLHGAVKVAAGIRQEFTLPSGQVGWIPGSIAFHKMEQIEFNEFYDKVCDLIAAHFLPGVTSEELKREVSLMIGATA